ncbi:DUF4278 domain-containing protein [Synechococcales cyanobacterium C]|uniref:DUF4278 domain-containing protein n=1 Tax=Petrachloros mirabilis ULC683 TaxID=2781853 RepID=A0A8K2A9X3_9CYAN|nr:DUF4278 domain-containing protein [Petrachloros mirabilis]NCJ08525.1 DUF4278 domain-containing protein [Petrachloros mirabilis ULC683]
MLQMIDCKKGRFTSQKPMSKAISSRQTLSYRGISHKVSENLQLSSTLANIAQTPGKDLRYRGTAYEIMQLVALTEHRTLSLKKLCYRGITYMKSGVEYVAA